MRRPAGVLVIGLLVAVLVGGCSIQRTERVTRIDDEDVPFGLLDPDAPGVAAVPGGQQIAIYLLDETGALVPTIRQVSSDPTLYEITRALGATTDDEAERGLQTKISGPDDILDVTLSGGTATVTLAAGASQTLTADPLGTVAQITCTLTLQAGVGLVRFAIEDQAIDIPRADGTLTDEPVGRDDYASLIAEG